MVTYIIIIEQHTISSGQIYGAFVPDFPGCTAMGKSLVAVLQEIQCALRKALLYQLEHQAHIPQPSTVEKLMTEYMLAGEELVSSQGMIVLVEILFDVIVSSERFAAAA